ncbi:alpha,alpha-trehalase TreF [Lysobacter sp. A421]
MRPQDHASPPPQAAIDDEQRSQARVAQIAPADTLTPADRYQELFVAVQGGRVFADSKTFVDCAPRDAPETILEAYRARQGTPDFDLSDFVGEYFTPEPPHHSEYVADPERPLLEHIDGLWDVLNRQPREHPVRSSLLPLPNPYVVPGGRFAEMYYWDSYFIMLGLAASGRRDLLRHMADNFAFLIDSYGHVPNGNRSYYLSRSQPPVFALMTELFEEQGVRSALAYLPRLRREHAYWMSGCEDLRPGEAHRHCVRLEDGTLLNRYWDDRDTPREESWLEDVSTVRTCVRPAHEVYRELRAAAASGWDFSSRWCGADGALSSIRTTAIVPVDLNAFLHKLEEQIAELSAAAGDEAGAAEFDDHARARRHAIDRWLWSDLHGTYLDYDWADGVPRQLLSAAMATPLFVGIANPGQARRVALSLRQHLLESGGLATTRNFSGEQWDRPNGWAPLQWLAIRGLADYGETRLSREISRRWLATVTGLYRREGKLVEKYMITATPDGIHGGGGGEYPLQDGFGWTNGVTRMLLGAAAPRPVRKPRRSH